MTAHDDQPAQAHQDRQSAVRSAMASQGVEVLIVTAPEEIYYLCGLNNQGHFVFTALVLATHSEPATLVARAMEGHTARAQALSCVFLGYGDDDDPAELVRGVVSDLAPQARTVGYQAESLSFPPRRWRSLDEVLGSPTWVDCTELLADTSSVRTDHEIEHLRNAGRLSDIGMNAGIEAATSGRTGGQVVGVIEHAMLTAGSDYPGFVPLVRSVDQISQEHVAWTDHEFTAGDALFLELSGASARYHAPLARTIPPSRAASDRAAEISRAGLNTIVQNLQPGRTADQVYRAWKQTVETLLDRPYQRHHCGYRVGIGFPPSWMAGRIDSLRPGNRMTLRPGMTFHIQSWLLDPSAGVHALSDTALVTTHGAELLTHTPHDRHRPT